MPSRASALSDETKPACNVKSPPVTTVMLSILAVTLLPIYTVLDDAPTPAFPAPAKPPAMVTTVELSLAFKVISPVASTWTPAPVLLARSWLLVIFAAMELFTSLTEMAPPTANLPAPAPPIATVTSVSFEVACRLRVESVSTVELSICAETSSNIRFTAIPAPTAPFFEPARPPAAATLTKLSLAMRAAEPTTSISLAVTTAVSASTLAAM